MEKSVRSRFIFSFAANLIRSGIGFMTTLMLARLLGANDYGRLIFLLASFVAFRQLMDMGASSAFFTFLSERKRSQRFISYYWRWLGIQFLCAVVGVWLVFPTSWIVLIWQGEQRYVVLLALLAAFMQQAVWPIAMQMAEANRETAKVQRLSLFFTASHLLVVITLWFFGLLAIPLLLTAVIVEWLVASILAIRLYKHLELIDENEVETPVSVWREYVVYCRPLLPYTVIGFMGEITDRWMLQRWGGAAEQAFYSIAQQFSAIALLATAAILKIFWKEISESHYQNDEKRVALLNQKVSRILYFIGALMAGGLMPWAEEIVSLMLGNEYRNGQYTLMVMFLYPVHQCLGQIGGVMALATKRVKIYSVIGSVSTLVGLLITYFTLAPHAAFIPGFQMGSLGLAVKQVVIQIISVNFLLYFISRAFSWKFDWLYQITVLGWLVALGWLAKYAVVSTLSISILGNMTVTGLLFICGAAVMMQVCPGLTGLQRSDVNSVINRIFKALRFKGRFN